jgi:hypothetical protein
MKRVLVFFAAILAAAISVSVAAGSALAVGAAYDATPNPLPPNVASVGFEATSTSEFGDYVHLAGINRDLKTVTVTMSDWALHSDYPPYPAAGWSHPITINVYSNNLGANGAPDTLLATKTETISIPWRPEADSTCPGGTAWRAGNGNCYNGFAFNATFDLSGLNVTLPNDVIVGVAYNTADYGVSPIGTPGPYNSLNVGTPNGQTASVGTDDNGDNVFWNTSFAGFYADGGAGGVGIFRQDTNWSPNGTAAIKINAAATCKPTGLFRDGINLTAAQIGGTVTGELDATGCNIGVYYGPTDSGSVSEAEIFGANYYGVVVSGSSTPVNITHSSIHDIGESPLNGSQHGVGVLYTTIDQAGNSTGATATGTLRGSTIADYQKNGVVVSGSGAKATAKNNTVTGQGKIDWIAQNGIQISFGATGTVTGNTVTKNFYTPKAYTACGLLFYDAKGVKQSDNVFAGNEVNVCNVGRGGGNVSQ